MFVPMIIPVPDQTHEKRIRQLEQALVLSLDIVQTLVERLEAKFGPGFLGPDLQHLSAATNPGGLEQEVANIDHLIADGHKPTAVKLFRESSGATWDEAQHAVSAWSRLSHADKLRTLRLSRLIKLLDAPQDAQQG